MSANSSFPHWSRQLLRPAFLLCLGLLILNDHYLKAEWGNWWTGKLSDFTGLFAFAFFWAALFPRQWKSIHVATVLGFIWWKSPLSEGFLEAAAGMGWEMSRVIDYSDLIALPMVGLSARLHRKPLPGQPHPGLKAIPVALLSIFAFVATSAPRYMVNRFSHKDVRYEFSFPFDSLTNHLAILSDEFVEKENWVYLDSTDFHWYIDGSINDTLGEVIDPLRVKDGDTVQLFSQYARVVLHSESPGSSIELLETGFLQSSLKDAKKKGKVTKRKFETDIIESLREKEAKK